MINSPFYFHTIRNVMVGFGDLFNDIHVIALDTDGNVAKDVTCPISPVRSQKWLQRINQEAIRAVESEAPNIEIQLPRMSYEITALNPDPGRKLPTLNTQYRSKDTAGLTAHFKQYSGNPYVLNVDLSIYTKKLDEMLQIIEQITPYFAPDMNITILDIPELDLRRDIPIILDSITPSNEFDGPLTEYELIQWTISFSIPFYMYPPVTDAEVIRRVIANIKENEDKTDVRLTNEVDPFDALETDDWTIIETKEDEPVT